MAQAQSTLTAPPEKPASSEKPANLAARTARSFKKRGVAGSLRVLSALAVVVALVTFSTPTWPWVLAGTPFVALGEIWRAWAAGHLVKSKELAISGPYRHVQNPLYFGRLCILIGFGLMASMPVTLGERVLPANLIVLGAMLAIFFGYYIPRKKRVEGERLLRLHGESYATFAAAVPLIIPMFRAWGRNVRPWTAERFNDNDEGWMVVFVSLVTAAFWAKALGLFG
jgi:protein-S-isoprenylcysteine O-methyltransferase Ste14